MHKILNPGASARGWHRLQLAAECLSKYAQTYLPGEPAQPAAPLSLADADDDDVEQTPAALARGGLMHLALGQHYMRMRNEQQGLDPNEWATPEAAIAVEAPKKGDNGLKYKDEVINVMRAYERHFFNDRREMRIIGAEELGETMIGGRWRLTGRHDLVYEDVAGRIYIMDHKTSARVTPKHKLYYAVSGQLLGYARMGYEKYKDKFAGIMLNLVQMGEEPTFSRLLLPRSPQLEAQFEARVVDIEESIERLVLAKRPYMEWPKAMSELTCYHRYGACQFIEQCRFGPGAQKAGNFKFDFNIAPR